MSPAVDVVLVVAERVAVDAGVPRVARLAPAVALDRLAGLLGLPVVEPVDVERAVEVVVLVLHAAGEPAGRVELDPVPVDVEADDVRAVGALEREGLAGHGQAALGLLVGVRALLRDPRGGERRVDDVPRSGTPSSLAIFQMKTRRPTPICGAARPTPLAASLVSYMSSTRVRRSSSKSVDEGCSPMEDGLAGDDDGAHAHAPSQARGVASARIGSDDSSSPAPSVLRPACRSPASPG